MRCLFAILLWLASSAASLGGEGPHRVLRVASFNLENYLLEPSGDRPAKPLAAREQVTRAISAIQPDLLAVQEIGGARALHELQRRLQTAGWEMPHAELASGWDTNLWVAILSRHPFRARRSHTNDSFLLRGRRWQTSRGIAEVEFEPRPGQRFIALTTHLKSKRAAAGANEAEVREAEMRILRGHVDAALRRAPAAALIVCGDFNDHPNSRPLRLLAGRGKSALVDARPTERGDSPSAPSGSSRPPRSVAWTHYYAEQDTYSRFDYIFLSPSLALRRDLGRSFIPVDADWGLASDHRLIVCEISLGE